MILSVPVKLKANVFVPKSASPSAVPSPVTPPKRGVDSYANVTQFEISDRKLKLQMK